MIQKTHIIVVLMNTILGSENIVFSINILCKTCECLPRIWSWKIVKMSWNSHEKVMDFVTKKVYEPCTIYLSIWFYVRNLVFNIAL